jgi:hypothetical protein
VCWYRHEVQVVVDVRHHLSAAEEVVGWA